MIVALDVSYLQNASAGIGRYSRGVVRSILSAERRPDITLHGWSLRLSMDELAGMGGGGIHRATARIPGAVKRFYWNKLRWPPLSVLIGPFDVFHSAEPLLPPLGKAAGVITVYDMAYRKFPEFFERSVLRRDPYVRRALREAHAIIVPSHATRDDLMEVFGVEEEKITLVRPPLPAGFDIRGDAAADISVVSRYGLNEPFALFVGTIEPRKNITGLVAAFAQLHGKRGCDLALAIAGKRGWLVNEALNAIRESPVRGKIRLLDFVPDSDLRSLYRRARFFVYPSMYEGYGLPVAEAMAAGLPVITSNNSSLREIAGGAAVLVNPLDTGEIAEAMDHLLRDERMRSSLSVAGIARIRELTAVDPASILIDVYHRAVRQ